MAAELRIPVQALAALRGAVLATPEGETRLRDAGFATGTALYNAFAEHARTTAGTDPTGLPLAAFVHELGTFFRDRGWGALDASTSDDGDTITVAAPDWAEADAEPEPPTLYPACHFSTGLFAGFLARVAGRPLAVLEVRCRAAGADRCEFTAGSPAVMDRLWEKMMRGGLSSAS